MNDLIERLWNEGCRQDDWANDGESTVVGSGPELLVQAADRIAELEAEVERQRQGIISLRTQYDELADKNERLREALQEISGLYYPAEIQRIAIEALAAVQEKVSDD